MKRKFLAFIAVSIIVFGTTLVPAGTFLFSVFGAQTAHAQSAGGSSSPTSSTGSGTAGGGGPSSSQTATNPLYNITGGNSGSPTNNTSGGTSALVTTAQNLPAGTQTTPTSQGSSLNCNGPTDIVCGLVEFTNFLMVGITGFIANLGAVVLDFSIHYSISSSTYTNTTVNGILSNGWKLIRDFSTIFLMFALFVVAFMMIFNAEGSEGSWAAHFSPGRTIARVIIVALLVNFSFLMCQAVIDVGNEFSLILYDKIDQGNASVQSYPTTAGSTAQAASTLIGNSSQTFLGTAFAGTKSISVGLLANINPQKVLLSNIGSPSGPGFYLTYLFISFVAAILNLIMLFIFVSMTVLFIGRVIGLYLGMILSPFAFVSWTIPFLQNMPYIGFDSWLKELIGLTFLAPVYMLFVYLTIAFMKIPTPTNTVTLLATAAFAVIDAMLCLFVLLKGKKIAESMAGEFGNVVARVANTVATAGVGLAIGGVGLAASGTIGAAGSAIATSGTLKRLQDGGPSQDQEAVQQRMKTASTFRKFGMNKIANSVERGDYSMGALKSNAAKGIRGFGKGLATTNPLDAKIAGLNIRNSTAAIAKMSGNKQLAEGLAKYEKKTADKAAIKDRALDIAATQNAKNTITNNQTNAVTSGLSTNPLASAKSTGTPARASGPVTVTQGSGNGTTGGVAQTFSLAGMTAAGQVRPPSTTPPPNNPPTGGASPAKKNPPTQGGVTGGRKIFMPQEIDTPKMGNRALLTDTGAVIEKNENYTTHPDYLKTKAAIAEQANKPKRTLDQVSAELKTAALRMEKTERPPANASRLDKDLYNKQQEEFSNLFAEKSRMLEEAEKNSPKQTEPLIKQSSSQPAATQASTYLSAIQSSPEQVAAPTQTIIREVATPTITTTQSVSKIIEQPQTIQRENIIQQASTVSGNGNSALRNISATQSALVQKNTMTSTPTRSLDDVSDELVVAARKMEKTERPPANASRLDKDLYDQQQAEFDRLLAEKHAILDANAANNKNS